MSATATAFSESGHRGPPIGWLVGYQDLSSFFHSCKRWTGMNPKKNTRQIAGEPLAELPGAQIYVRQRNGAHVTNGHRHPIWAETEPSGSGAPRCVQEPAAAGSHKPKVRQLVRQKKGPPTRGPLSPIRLRSKDDAAPEPRVPSEACAADDRRRYDDGGSHDYRGRHDRWSNDDSPPFGRQPPYGPW